MPFAVARTRDEAYLYLELHPCEQCGETGAQWEHGLAEDDEGDPAGAYWATCPGCGTEREYVFGLPEREHLTDRWPNFGGAEPSEVIDAGQWLGIADANAGAVPDDREAAERVLSVARAAVDEVLKFIPAGTTEVPDDAFWTDDGRRLRDAEPGRFALDRLLVVRDSYLEDR